MRFTESPVTVTKEILYNDHYVAIPYDLTDLSSLSTNGLTAFCCIWSLTDRFRSDSTWSGARC